MSPSDPADATVARVAAILRDAPHRAIVEDRVRRHHDRVFKLVSELYPERTDEVMAGLMATAAEAARERTPELLGLDLEREADPEWHRSHRTLGAMCYTDRFAGTFKGLSHHIGYLHELGVTYLHLMPPYRTPPGGGDGGYAVSNYREVAAGLGTIDELRDLATELRTHGIDLALDLVFNHTADDHPWALAAAGGDPFFRDFYFIFPDREMPDRYDRTLREIFPETRRGNFTHVDGVGWVWTTFNSFQWDLNYRNPHVLRYMLGELLFLANLGADVVRLDAVPFIWKAEGTSSENLPEVHSIIRLLNLMVRIAAPATVFKSEAIVHPDDVLSYLGEGECELSYNPLFMVELWEAMATGYTSLMRRSVATRFVTPPGTTWVNYLRSHDDIGWGFANEDAEAVGIHGFYHRQYLNDFYTGQAEGSFARGLPFQFNPDTLDMRISGTTASLVGVEQALETGDEEALDLAVRRMLTMYGLTMSIGGMPLVYLGDEIAMLNDPSYLEEPDLSGDSRWAHRPHLDWERAGLRTDPGTVPGAVHTGLRRMAMERRHRPAFGAAASTALVDLESPHLFAFVKEADDDRVFVVANFAAGETMVAAHELPFGGIDRLSGREVPPDENLVVTPYELLWIVD